MAKNGLKKAILKNKIKSVSKGTWIFLSIMTFIVLSAIALVIVGMYLNGYTLAKFFGKFYAWFVLVGVVLFLAIIFVLFNKFRKGR